VLAELNTSEIKALLAKLDKMPAAEKQALLEGLDALEHKKRVRECRDSFLAFCRRVYPDWKEGPHHRFLAPILHKTRDGQEKRLTVSMPPRFGKSETIAYLFVAWYLGHHPNHHIMMVTHTAALSADFGRKVRNLIDSEAYQEIFPDTKVSKDKSAADSWTTTKEGKYLGLGIGGNVAGHGAHLLIADDLVSEQAVLSNPDHAFDVAWNYMQVGPLQRLMPGGRIVMIGTRWGKRDPIGRALKWAEDNPDADPWHEIRFPAILPSGRSLWPEQWPVEQLLAKKAGMQPHYWAAQYMQEPTSEEGALLKREYWRIWPHDDPPPVEYVLQVWDTAHDTKSMNDYSACTTWGVWYNEEDGNSPHLILLDAFKDRMMFPELKETAFKHWKEWDPDAFIVEKKAAGSPLIQELRRMGIPVQEFTPSRGNDKIARMNAVSDLFASGKVWAPDTRWAREVIEEIAAFPVCDHDDFVDTTTQALLRYRQGGFISLPSDYDAGATKSTTQLCIHQRKLRTNHGDEF